MARTARKNNVVEMPSPERRTVDDTAIAQRAYEIYESRGGVHGRDVDDWLQAEREVSGSAPRRES